MSITLSKDGTTITLPDDILWEDRHSWSPVVQTVSPSITGAAIIDVGERLNGRPITLVSDEQHAWFSYAIASQLKTWAAIPGGQMSLSIFGSTYTVIFRHQEAPALTLFPVVDYNTPDAEDFFYGAIKLTEV